MKHIKFTLALFLVFTLQSFSQAVRNAGLRSVQSNLISSRVVDQPWNPTEFVGSPYYDTQYKLGKVYFNDSIIADNILLRYNVHKEVIEIRGNQDGKIETIQSKPGISFDYGNEHFSLMFNPITGMKQFFRKVYQGPEYAVYLKPIKVFKEGQKAVTHLTRDILPSYITKDTYYFQIGKKFEEIRTSRSGVRKIFPKFKDEIKEFIKEKDFRFKEDTFERELTEVIHFYESLQEQATGNGDIVKKP